MAKLISPARIPERKKLFCSSVPYRMSIGPTVLRVTNGKRCPGSLDLGEEDELIGGRAPCPPYSLGQPIPSQPSLPIRRTRTAGDLAALVLAVERLADVSGQQFGEIGPKLVPQGLLLRGLLQVHGSAFPFHCLCTVSACCTDPALHCPASALARLCTARHSSLRTGTAVEARGAVPYDN